MNRLDQLMKAAKSMDWRQAILNGGAPCFFIEPDGRFCGRSALWSGHHQHSGHPFVTLDQVFESVAVEVRREMLS